MLKNLSDDEKQALIHLGDKVYDDAVKPVAKNVSKTATSATRFIHALVGRPLDIFSIKLESFWDKTEKEIRERKKRIPIENRIEPSLGMISSVCKNILASADSPDLHELFINLIQNSMDSRTAKGILPVYADILAQLSSDEAKMLRCLYLEKGGYAGIIDVNSLDDNFALLTLATGINALVYDAKCDIPENNQIYIDNLSRLQLIKIDMINGFVDERHYERLIQLPQVLELKSNIEVLAHKHFNVTRGRLLLSELGKGLCEACSVDIL